MAGAIKIWIVTRSGMSQRKQFAVLFWTILLFLLFPQNAFAGSPAEIRITNVRGTQFTVSWISEDEETGQVRYGTSLDEYADWLIANDDRGASTVDDIHHVTITGLTPNATYYYEIISGDTVDDNGGSYYSINPGPALTPSGSCQPAGKVFKHQAKIQPAYDSIVYVTILGEANEQDSATESVLVMLDTNGYWFLDLVNFRTRDYKAFFPFTCGASYILVEAQGGSEGAARMPTQAVDFQTAARPDIVLGAGPTGGYIADNVIPSAEISQSTDGDGIITIRFKIKDTSGDNCTLHSFQYSVDGGETWNAPANGDDSEALDSGWKDNGGASYSSAQDFESAEGHSFTFNTQHQDVSGLEDEDQSDVQVRFTVNDGRCDSLSPVTSENIRVDNLSPTVKVEYSEPDPYRDSDEITIMACFSEEIAATPKIAIDYAGTGSDVPPTDMTDTGDSKIWTFEVDIPPGNDGTAKITITGSDAAGNPVGAHTGNTFEVDNTEPVKPEITTHSGDDFSTTDSDITFEGTCSADTYAIKVNGSSDGVNYISSDTSWTYEGPLDAAENPFDVTAEDEAGNVSKPDSIMITSCRPYTPILVLPSNGKENMPLTPELQTDSFSHPCDSTHQMTGWQISTESDFSSFLLDVTSSSHRASLKVPHSTLDEDTTYYWRVIFYDNNLVASDWSETFSFTTSKLNRDQNGNGVPDDQECEHITNQDNQKCVKTAAGDGEIEISSTGSSIEWLESIDPDTISDTSKRPENLPFGLITFKLMVNDPGDAADLTVDLSRATSDTEALDEFFEEGRWYKYDTINGWQDFSDHATFYPGKRVVVLSLTDGGTGDSDGTKNRIIVDPSGLGAGNMAPEASFTANPTSGEEPLRVHFDATASKDFDGEIVTYDWNYGDGSTGSGVTTSHQYSSKGGYTVTLTVTDDDGMTDEATAIITVEEEKAWCPISVAVSGSPMEPLLDVLREFRDRILKLIPGGNAFISLYYDSSPSVASVLMTHETLRIMVRWSLLPVIGISWMALHCGVWLTLALMSMLLCLVGAGAVIVARRIGLRGKHKAV